MAIKHSVSDKSQGDILTAANWNADHSIGAFEATGAITMSGDGLVNLELCAHIDSEFIRTKEKPTGVNRGVFRGFSLPVFNDDDEQLFLDMRVPNRWDGASDVTVHVYCWLASAEDTKNFKFQLAWEKATIGTDAIPATTNIVEVETATGASAAQYQSYDVSFTIDYDIDTPDVLAGDDNLAIRLRRIAASANDCAGEIVIKQMGAVFRRDKMGHAVT